MIGLHEPRPAARHDGADTPDAGHLVAHDDQQPSRLLRAGVAVGQHHRIGRARLHVVTPQGAGRLSRRAQLAAVPRIAGDRRDARPPQPVSAPDPEAVRASARFSRSSRFAAFSCTAPVSSVTSVR